MSIISRGLRIAAVAGAFIVGPLVAWDMLQKTASADAEDNIDQSATEIFRKGIDCVKKGYAEEDCQDSYNLAYAQAGNAETGVFYNSPEACQAAHGSCNIAVTPHYQEVTKKIKIREVAYAYHPKIVAWQAARDDITSRAVPLYATPEKDVAVRKDGKKFSL